MREVQVGDSYLEMEDVFLEMVEVFLSATNSRHRRN